jgi:hypothetical protein
MDMLVQKEHHLTVLDYQFALKKIKIFIFLLFSCYWLLSFVFNPEYRQYFDHRLGPIGHRHLNYPSYYYYSYLNDASDDPMTTTSPKRFLKHFPIRQHTDMRTNLGWPNWNGTQVMGLNRGWQIRMCVVSLSTVGLRC